MSDDGVVASALEVVEIAEAVRLLAEGRPGPFSEAERAYALARRDPARRLAARLAAKRAASRLLGAGVAVTDVQVLRGSLGPPHLDFSETARRRLAQLGASRALVSLTHGIEHAAASVLLLRDP